LAKLDLELSKNKEEIQKLKSSLKKRRETKLKLLNKKSLNSLNQFYKKDGFLKSEKLAFYLTKSRDVINNYKEEKVSEELQISIKNISKFIEEADRDNQENNLIIDKIKNLENTDSQIKNEIKEIKAKEICRLFREIIKNDYERRFNTTRHAVISALVGEESCLVELDKLKREEKVKLYNIYILLNCHIKDYIEKLKLCRNYNNLSESLRWTKSTFDRLY